MRLITWNCAGRFRDKSARVAALAPDILVVPECEPAAFDQQLDFGGLSQASCHWFGVRIPRAKGLAVFSFGGIELEPVSVSDPLHFFSPVTVRSPGGSGFQLAGIWTTPNDYRQAHEGLARHREWIAGADTLLLGDFNNNRTHEVGRKTPWEDLLVLLEPLGLVSAYHEHHGEAFGQESRQTFRGRAAGSSAYHIDFVFVPRSWVPRIQGVSVGDLNEWAERNGEVGGSDHAPVVVDLNLG